MSGRGRQQLLQDIDDDEQSWSHRDLLNATAASTGKVSSLLSKETENSDDGDDGGSDERSLHPTAGASQGRAIIIQSPGTSSRMSMSGKIESYDAISSSLPLHDQQVSSVEVGGGATAGSSSSSMAAMERRLRQLEEINQTVVSKLQLQLAKETERSEKLQDTCDELKNQVKELWYELGQERSQRKQLVTSIQQGTKPRHSFRVEGGSGTKSKDGSKSETKNTTKSAKNKPLPRQLQNAAGTTGEEDGEEEEIVYTPEVLQNLKQIAIKRVSSRESMRKKAKKSKSSSTGTNDDGADDEDDEIYYTSEVLNNMKQEAIERLSMKSDAMSNASSSRRSRQFVYADTDDEDEEENVVYTPEVLATMKQEAIKRVSSGGERESSSSTTPIEPPPPTVNGCAVCCRMICILIGVIIMMVGLIAGSYYIGKATFPKREAITTLPPTIIETLVPTTTADVIETVIETMVPTTIETSGSRTSNLMVQSDAVAVPAQETNEEGEESSPASSSSTTGIVPVRQRGGLGRSLQIK